MKRIIILFLFVISFITAYSLNTEIVAEYYKNYISDYKSENSQINIVKNLKEDLSNLGYYRFYRNNMIGTAEYAESPSNIQSYLSLIKNDMTYDTQEEEFAFTGLLMFVQAELGGTNVSDEMIKSMPAYFNTVEDYKKSIQDEAYTYIGNVIAYSLGIIGNSPYTDVKKFKTDGEIYNLDFYTYYGERNVLLDSLIEDKKDYLEKSIKDLADSGITGEDLEYSIDDISTELLKSVSVQIENEMTQIRKIFTVNESQKINLWYIRIIIYVALFIILYIFKRKLIPAAGILVYITEFIYILFFFQYGKDIITSFIYGSFVLIAGIFVFIYIFVKAFKRNEKLYIRLVNILMFVAMVMIFTLPAYYANDLSMKNKNNFHDSIFEQQLLNDLVIYNHSPLAKHINDLRYETGIEFSNVKKLYENTLRNLVKGAVENDFLEYLYSDKIDGTDIKVINENLNYLNREEYKKLLSDYKKDITKFENSTNMRKSRIESAVKNIDNTLKSVYLYSDETFINKMDNIINTELSKNSFTKVFYDGIAEKSSGNKFSESFSLKLYNTAFGTKLIIVFLFSVMLFVVYEKGIFKLISYLGIIVSVVLAFIRPSTLEIMSQLNYPEIFTSDYSVNILFSFMFLIIAVLLIIQRGGSKE